MNSADRERLVAEGFDAFNRGDVQTLLAIFDPQVECHVSQGLANTGTWYGHQGFIEMITEWNEAFASQVLTVIRVTHPDEHHSIAEVHQRAVGAGSGVETEMTMHYLFEIRDGRATRLHLYMDPADALAAVR